MKSRSLTNAGLAALILGLTAISVLPAQAQNRDYNNNYGNNYNRGQNQAPQSPRVEFRRQPRWMRVQGTNVQMTSMRQRPAYDLFKLGNMYYIHGNGYWYRSNRWNGKYTAIDLRYVPAEFMNVPRQYWRDYPEAWATRTDNGSHNGQYQRHHR